MAASPILSARHVAKNYGAVAALKDASLDVAPGEVIALLGANGAGKSTLVKILTGAISPSAGKSPSVATVLTSVPRRMHAAPGLFLSIRNPPSFPT